MSTFVLHRRVARQCHLLSGLNKEFLQIQHLHKAYGKPKAEANKREGEEVVLQSPDVVPVPESYRLHYNPSSYYTTWSMLMSTACVSKRESEEDEHYLIRPTCSFRQKRNHYSVSSSRRLSSTKTTLLELALNKGSVAKAQSKYCRDYPPTDIKVSSRAFQKCRPEYASMSLDLTQKPSPVEAKQALLLLHKVTVLKCSMTTSDLAKFFTELSHLYDSSTVVKSDTRFIMLLRYSVENLHHFTHSELLEVLKSFVWLDLPSTHSVLGLYEAELRCRASQMSFHQLLLAADLWRCLRRQVPRFLEHLYDSVKLDVEQISVPEMVQLLYIIGESRHCPSKLVHPIEQILLHNLDRLQPEEVGAVCLALFKSQTSLSESTVKYLVDKAYSLAEEVSDFAMVNVLKLLRFSYLDHRGWLQVMVQEVPRRAPRMDVQGLMHVALACSALHYRNDCILLAIAERIPSLAPSCRSKDSSKLLWAFGTLGVLPSQCTDFYPSLTEALRQRKSEFQRYPEHLLSGLLGLAFVSQFPEDLLAFALSPEFVNLSIRNSQLELKKDLFTLDETVALELPHFTGPRLSSELCDEVTKLLWNYAQSDVCQKPEVLQAECSLQELLGGEEFVVKRMILPHTRSIDLEVHLDSSGEPIPVKKPIQDASSSGKKPYTSRLNGGWERVNLEVALTEELLAQLTNSKGTMDHFTPPSAYHSSLLHRKDLDKASRLLGAELDPTNGFSKVYKQPSTHRILHKATVKLAIQVSNRNHYCYQSQQLLGLHAMKRRQLKVAGYRVLELPPWEWFPLLRKSRAEKLAYLHCKIYSSLNSA
ncbi:FAST kinase domain-containing protein 5, mitochondrial isoform X2 [Lampris incognitus]|nr:FAST kinase domain-containing protein 5, mitochondrial isoform X2 [Lampris incognitus]